MNWQMDRELLAEQHQEALAQGCDLAGPYETAMSDLRPEYFEAAYLEFWRTHQLCSGSNGMPRIVEIPDATA